MILSISNTDTPRWFNPAETNGGGEQCQVNEEEKSLHKNIVMEI
jgi:hypothetical protein